MKELSSDNGSTAAPGGRRAVLVALYASVFTFGVAFGGIVPWMALVLEARGTDTIMIGIVSAANPVGVILMAPFVGRLVRRLTMADAIIYSSLVGIVSLALLAVFDSTAGWLLLRFVSGLAGAVPWILTETWINQIAGDRSRGRIIALYGALLAAGFAAGPVVLTMVGIGGLTPLAIFLVLSVVSLAPVVLVRRYASPLEAEGRQTAWALLLTLPTVFAAAILAGAVDTAFFAFLPIWGLRIGLDGGLAVLLLSVFIAGNAVLQPPIGWLADRCGSRFMMAACGVVCLIGPPAAYLAIGWPFLLGIVLFFWGGGVWGAYTVALIEIGHRCRGTTLAAANGLFVLVYTAANIAAPPLTGLAMELSDPHGFMAVTVIVAIGFMAVVVLERRR